MRNNRTHFQSMHVRNIPNSTVEKMKTIKEKNNKMTFSRQIRLALSFWLSNHEDL